jgi:hypothetical protein
MLEIILSIFQARINPAHQLPSYAFDDVLFEECVE